MPRKPVTYTVSQIADDLNVSTDTVRRYTRHFDSHLSEDASPEPGSVRLFTPADLFMLRQAREYMRSGHTYDQTDDYLATIRAPDDLPEETSTDLATTAAVQQVTSALLSLTETIEQQNALLTRTDAQESRIDAQEDAQTRIASQLERIERNQQELAQTARRPLFWAVVGAFVAALVILATVALALSMGWIG